MHVTSSKIRNTLLSTLGDAVLRIGTKSELLDFGGLAFIETVKEKKCYKKISVSVCNTD